MMRDKKGQKIMDLGSVNSFGLAAFPWQSLSRNCSLFTFRIG